METKSAKRDVYMYGAYGFLNTFALVPMSFLNIFLTEDLKITPVAAGSILMAARIIDFVISFMIGAIMEKVQFKSGRYLPWLRFSRPIIYVGQVLMFIPFNMPYVLRMALILVAYLLVNTFRSFIVTAQYGVITLASGADLDKRNRMTILSTRLTTVASVITTASNSIVRNWLSDMFGSMIKYLLIAIIYGVFTILSNMMLSTVVNPYDGPELAGTATAPRRKITVADMIKCVATNSQLIIYIISTVLYFIGSQSPMQITMYYYIYIQNDPKLLLYALAQTITQVFSLVCTMVGPSIGLRLGRKNARFWGQFLSGVSSVLMCFFGQYHIIVFIGLNMFTRLAAAIYSGFAASYIIDVGEYGYWKTGIDNRIVNNSLVNIPTKISSFIGGSLGLFGLAYIGFKSGMTVDATFTRNFMYLYGGISAVCYFLASFMTKFMYKIDDAEAKLYASENRAREAAAKEAAAAAAAASQSN